MTKRGKSLREQDGNFVIISLHAHLNLYAVKKWNHAFSNCFLYLGSFSAFSMIISQLFSKAEKALIAFVWNTFINLVLFLFK